MYMYIIKFQKNTFSFCGDILQMPFRKFIGSGTPSKKMPYFMFDKSPIEFETGSKFTEFTAYFLKKKN